jgi:hypothetical protein
MNTRKIIFWCGLMLAALVTSWAAEVGAAAPAAASAGTNGLLLALIPVIVPLIIALGKWAVPKVPAWILPILAPALGALVDFLSSWATGSTASPALGAILGSAGVGVRELLDQVKGRLKDGAVVPLLLLTFALPAATLTIGVTGCAWLKNTPAETVAYFSFKDSWALTKTAYDKWSERVVQGKVTQEKSDAVDAAWNKYRSAFRTSMALAQQDWSAISPATLIVIQNELLTLITNLSK